MPTSQTYYTPTIFGTQFSDHLLSTSEYLNLVNIDCKTLPSASDALLNASYPSQLFTKHRTFSIIFKLLSVHIQHVRACSFEDARANLFIYETNHYHSFHKSSVEPMIKTCWHRFLLQPFSPLWSDPPISRRSSSGFLYWTTPPSPYNILCFAKTIFVRFNALSHRPTSPMFDLSAWKVQGEKSPHNYAFRKSSIYYCRSQFSDHQFYDPPFALSQSPLLLLCLSTLGSGILIHSWLNR